VALQFDPILVRRLATDLSERLAGRRTRALVMDREMRAAELRCASGPSLLFLLHPGAGFLLEAPAGSLERLSLAATRGPAGGGIDRVLSRKRPTFIPVPAATRGAWSPADERLLVLELGSRSGRRRLVAELLTNQWNLLLLEAGDQEPAGGEGWGRIAAVLWPRRTGGRDLAPGRPYRPPAFPGGSRRWRSEPPTRAGWSDLLVDVPTERRAAVLLREAAGTSSLVTGWILGEAGRSGSGDDGGEASGDRRPGRAGPDPRLEDARTRYLELLSLVGIGGPGDAAGAGDAGAGATGRERSGPGAAAATGEAAPAPGAWLLPGPAGPQPYPHPLGRDDAAPAPGLLAAFRRAAAASPRWSAVALPAAGAEAAAPGSGAGEGALGPSASPLDPDALRLEAALREEADRAERRAAALERELTGGPKPGRLREDANLLLARLRDVPRGAGRVTLEDFDGGRREIELDPALSAADNAERMYDEAARRERAAERLPATIARARDRAAAIQDALERLPESGPTAELWDLAGGLPATGPERRSARGAPLPYRTYRSSGGLEIRVGRGARQNDQLTFHHSHTEDIWLHARQVPGAHVILRWGRKDENPPRRDLLEAAVAAAVHSDARHSGTVGVDWTRRKYVRSPRKAPPGRVIPERVRTVFVEPSEALLEKLKVRS